MDKATLDLAYWNAYELREYLNGWEYYEDRMALEDYMDHISWMHYFW